MDRFYIFIELFYKYFKEDDNMERKTIVVLFGGCSSEYDVSLMSAYSVLENINTEKYYVIMIGITQDGQWLKYDGDIVYIKDNTWMKHSSCVPAVISPDRMTHGIIVMEKNNTNTISVDIVFPVLHGRNGEDGTIQGLLELSGINMVGCGSLSSALCMDKDLAHKIVKHSGIKTPNAIVINSNTSTVNLLNKTKNLKYPLFVKPVGGGSSLGVRKIYDPKDLQEAVKYAFIYDKRVIIEETITGFEVGCAILGTQKLVVGEVDEIELSGDFFDYTEKYTLKTSNIHMPARIDLQTKILIKNTAEKIYRLLGCSGFARVDMFLSNHGEIIFNEVNTIPGFTSHSRYPNMLKGIGLSYEQVLDELINLAVEK